MRCRSLRLRCGTQPRSRCRKRCRSRRLRCGTQPRSRCRKRCPSRHRTDAPSGNLCVHAYEVRDQLGDRHVVVVYPGVGVTVGKKAGKKAGNGPTRLDHCYVCVPESVPESAPARVPEMASSGRYLSQHGYGSPLHGWAQSLTNPNKYDDWTATVGLVGVQRRRRSGRSNMVFGRPELVDV